MTQMGRFSCCSGALWEHCHPGAMGVRELLHEGCSRNREGGNIHEFYLKAGPLVSFCFLNALLLLIRVSTFPGVERTL